MLGVCLKYEQNNYGSKLQALATVTLFEDLGLDYEIIRYNKDLRFYIRSLPRFFNIVFLNDRYDQIQRNIQYKRHADVRELVNMRYRAFASFDSYFERHLSELYPSYEALCSLCRERYGHTVSCSDQLWSPAALGSGFYNLMFVPDGTKKISLASSFGVSRIPWYQRKRTKEYLSRIEHISMRENQGAEIVKELTGRDVPVLMDPVFSISRERWDELIPSAESEWGEYIFCYFLGSNPEHRRIARELSDKTGMKIVTLRHLDRYVAEDESFGDFAPYDVDPHRFLNILRNAKYICTDSFHGTAFSIIYGKKFLVFDRYLKNSANSKNSRIDSVCENLGLCDRRYSAGCDVLECIDREVDYQEVMRRVSEYREGTLSYLRDVFEIK